MSIRSIVKKCKPIRSMYCWLRSEGYNALTLISPTLNTKVRYRMIFGKRLNLKCPQTLNEKILWLKLNKYMNDPLVIQCADKVSVREYVEHCGCSEILNDVISIYNSAEEIEWEKLPQQFVMKWNFGAGLNLVCTDKNQLNRNDVIRQMHNWGKVKYWLPYSEMQYKYIDRKIICEKLLNDTDNSLDVTKDWTAPKDYKVYCFNGKAEFVMVCVGREQDKDPLFLYYDRNWNLLPYSQDALNHPDYFLEKPNCLDVLFKYAEKLSEPFPFVRADFYCCLDNVYFGELTFTPGAGMDNSRLPAIDKLFGDMVNLKV